MALVPRRASWPRIRNAPTRKPRLRLVRRIILLECDVTEKNKEQQTMKMDAGVRLAVGGVRNVKRQEFLLSFEVD